MSLPHLILIDLFQTFVLFVFQSFVKGVTTSLSTPFHQTSSPELMQYHSVSSPRQGAVFCQVCCCKSNSNNQICKLFTL